MEERAWAGNDPQEPGGPQAPEGRRGPWWRRPAAVASAVVVVAAVGVGVAFAARGGGSGPAPAAQPTASASSIVVQGTLELSFGTTFSPNASDPEPDRAAGPRIGDPCTALGGYGDITQGAAVTIGDGSGRTLAVTGLGAGSVGGDESQALCDFPFTVTVPAGRGTYTVAVSHRGTQVFTEGQIESPVTLTLGG